MHVAATSVLPDLDASAPRAMTRCECAEMAFSAIARLHREAGLSLEEIGRRTGCGRMCTACLPDLRDYLKSD
jgi:bacterioferritin-associated ferredoxin